MAVAQANGEHQGMAMESVGLCYAQGLGVQEDHKQALQWRRNAPRLPALSPDPPDPDVPPIPEALMWYRKAAKKGCALGMYGIGISYDEGLGIPENKTLAAKWFAKAADLGVRDGMASLARLLDMDAANGVAHSRTQSFAW